MLFDLREIHTESDMHGAPCPICADGSCVTNLYVTNPDGEIDTRYTCKSATCMGHALATHHHGDEMPLIELSTAPMPWVLTAVPAPVIAAGDLGCVTGSVTPAGRVA